MPKIKHLKRKYLENGGSYYYDKEQQTWFFEYRKEASRFNYRPIRKRLRAKTEAMLKTKIAQFQEELNEKPKDITTIDELIAEWFKNTIEGNVSQNTINFYKNKADFILEAFGDREIKSVSINEIEHFLNHLSDKGGKKKKGLAASSVNATRKIIKSIYNYAIQHNYATINPTIGIRGKKNIKQPNTDALCILDEEELQRFLDTAKAGEYIYEGVKDKRELVKNDAIDYNIKTAYLLTLLAFSTGMRIGELRGLKREDFDFSKNQITVSEQLLRYDALKGLPNKSQIEKLLQKAEETQSKRDIKKAESVNPFQPLKTTNSNRIIDIDPSITKEVQTFIEFQDKYASEHPNYKNEWNLLLTNGVGHPINEQNFRRRYFDKILKTANIKKTLTLHKMRHTHASMLLKHGIDIAIISRRLGHANPTITYNIYVHVLPETMSKAGKIWSKIIKM
ncbi:MAG: site-specific integrase [Phascolarctobacterium sp.]|nr:site-specific integrase [Candidatus Phascolarctobacterium caballi]